MTGSLKQRYGDWAVITGGARASGLGFAFARRLASEGVSIVLVDILEAELQQRAAELRQQYGVEARAVPLDLAQVDFIDTLTAQTADIVVGMLICNHMYTPTDTPKMLDMDYSVLSRMLDINARAYTALMHAYGRQMRDQKRGAIVVVGSGAGLVPAPYTSAYSANKAYQIALGQTLWYELKGTGVDVVVLAAGLMKTQGDALSKYPQFMVADPTEAVTETLAHLGRKQLVVPGWINKAFMFMQTKLMSRQQATNSIGDFMAKGLGKD